MRDIIALQIDEKREPMFGRAAADAHHDLMAICHSTRADLQTYLDRLTGNVSRDYRAAIVEAQIQKFSQKQTKIRREVRRSSRGCGRAEAAGAFGEQ